MQFIFTYLKLCVKIYNLDTENIETSIKYQQLILRKSEYIFSSPATANYPKLNSLKKNNKIRCIV